MPIYIPKSGKHQFKGSGMVIFILPCPLGVGPRFYHKPPKISSVDTSVFTVLRLLLPVLSGEDHSSSHIQGNSTFTK